MTCRSVLVLFGWLLPLPATAQTITNLGLTPSMPGGGRVAATGVSADGGVVTGWSSVWPGGGEGVRAFRWTPAGGLQNLGTGAGFVDTSGEAISADGAVIAGRGGASGSFRWAGGYQSLGTLPGYTFAEARAMSADGLTIAGMSVNLGTWPYDVRAFRWTAAGGMHDLGVLPGMTGSEALGISGDGLVVVGHSGDGSSHVFRWTSAGGMQDLGTLPGHSDARATAANADGSVVVGWSIAGAGPDERAFRWTAAGGMQDLSGGSGGWNGTRATAVSGDGTIVVGRRVDIIRGFLWTSSFGIVDLRGYLSLLGVNLTGWDHLSPTAISADGTAIVGEGWFNGVSGYSWIVTGLSVVCYPDCDTSTGPNNLDIFDFLCFQNRFAVNDPYACNCDVSTGQNVCDIFDFLCFQNAFAAGCQ